MSESRAPELGINSWLEDELYQQYLNDRKTVDESWKEVFETNGGAAPPALDGVAGITEIYGIREWLLIQSNALFKRPESGRISH